MGCPSRAQRPPLIPGGQRDDLATVRTCLEPGCVYAVRVINRLEDRIHVLEQQVEVQRKQLVELRKDRDRIAGMLPQGYVG